MERKPVNPNMLTPVERLHAHTDAMRDVLAYFNLNRAAPNGFEVATANLAAAKLRYYDGSPAHVEFNHIAHVISPEPHAVSEIPLSVDNFNMGAMLGSVIAKKIWGDSAMRVLAAEAESFREPFVEQLRQDEDFDFRTAVAEAVGSRSEIGLAQMPEYGNVLKGIFANSRRNEFEQTYFKLGFGFVMFLSLKALQKNDAEDKQQFAQLAKDAETIDWDWVASVLETMDPNDRHTFHPQDE